MAKLILVTGAARSGKSEWAEKLAADSGKPVIYIATAQENLEDLEWQARIEKHRSRRPEIWQTRSIPVKLSSAIVDSSASDCLLIDSLGTWLANVLDQTEAEWQETLDTLFQSFDRTESLIIFVAEETGWGIVPAYPIGRLFRDRLGNLVRELGAIADTVYLVAGGHILNLSQLGTPLKSNP
ncbi:bifunctional adenosylcobinamide kinase/adenosylcobinamide-phosphate guanylyltransferase [Leptolyngbya sp. FACHB-17]|uniref:bifunctional adenosylcobinamide kinase/adenosylcobinamide-phosphate guanylyltransferase n=1 Tax=unclassified Leptolyngbya TaxID=2650499 RepID=UPI001681ADCD|nr:bifunctional adenosylcobinamide kinase/adenosylcobinamide-phosphate guanylyltransferase [Leptolyngbya sp. FACHB-17]MBD2079509.1 bifunctional adenosylcobinamide kinase/adenosylcobinamide-phosphate guanylyltransferase [Leptolyngbya sp. FACHB-17]